MYFKLNSRGQWAYVIFITSVTLNSPFNGATNKSMFNLELGLAGKFQKLKSSLVKACCTFVQLVEIFYQHFLKQFALLVNDTKALQLKQSEFFTVLAKRLLETDKK